MPGCRLLLLVVALSPLVGCTSLPGLSSPLASAPDPAAVANGQQAMVLVELRPEGKKPKVYQMPLEGEMNVQHAVEKSRAKRKFRRMFVTVLRTTPEGRRHKMDCQYDHAKRQIAAHYDYALQPGDYIVIAEDTSTALDDLFADAVEPLGVFGH